VRRGRAPVAVTLRQGWPRPTGYRIRVRQTPRCGGHRGWSPPRPQRGPTQSTSPNCSRPTSGLLWFRASAGRPGRLLDWEGFRLLVKTEPAGSRFGGADGGDPRVVDRDHARSKTIMYLGAWPAHGGRSLPGKDPVHARSGRPRGSNAMLMGGPERFGWQRGWRTAAKAQAGWLTRDRQGAMPVRVVQSRCFRHREVAVEQIQGRLWLRASTLAAGGGPYHALDPVRAD